MLFLEFSKIKRYDEVSTKGILTTTYLKNIEDDSWTKTYHFYDNKGRPVATNINNHLGGYTKTETELDFSGLPKQTITRHKRLSTDTEKVIIENFTYDDQNRLLTHTHQIDSNPVEILAQNTYNELSQLESKKVGGTNPSFPLQTVDYTYNIRGWMTKINDPANLGNDLFGYKINYNQVEGLETPDALDPSLMVKPKYNGNIAEVSWKTLTEDNEPLKRYGYVYDPLNRLSAGFYQKAGTESAKEYFEKLEYDINGNITRLKRSERVLAGNTTATMIDNLRYDYEGNRLTKVTDEQQNPSGYPYLQTPNIIQYDNGLANGNGNMTSHLDKAISSIQYNFLNLPKQITQNSKATDFVYRADGVKVKKLFGNVETGYLDGFQYKSTFSWETWNGQGTYIPNPNEVPVLKLRIIPTSEGYYDVLKEQYIYNFTDHLGNVRLSYSDTSKDGIIQPRWYNASNCTGWFCLEDWRPGEIAEVNDYYPFGLLHNYTATSQNAYQYKYNGKELQETGMYDYGARFYMPEVGRWGVIDPLAEKYRRWSPYNYTVDDPINHIDPDGMDVLETSRGTTYTGAEAQSVFSQLRSSISPEKEYPNEYKGKLGQGDWRKSDRENNTRVWQNANEYNIQQANGSNEYTNLDQRADFYRWFQSATDKKGFQTKWSGAAATTVDNLKNLIGDYDSYFGIDVSNTEIRNFVKGGNKLILNHIWSSLQDLYNGPVLKGQAAVNWDGQNLVNEQHLIQAEYNKLSPASVKILNSNLSWFTPFKGSVLNLNNRYVYGMSSMGYTVKWEKGAKINTNVKTR